MQKRTTTTTVVTFYDVAFLRECGLPVSSSITLVEPIRISGDAPIRGFRVTVEHPWKYAYAKKHKRVWRR